MIEFAGNVALKLTDNPDCPNPDVAPAQLNATANDLMTAAMNADGGGILKTSIKNEIKQTLIGLLLQDADYVNKIAKKTNL